MSRYFAVVVLERSTPEGFEQFKSKMKENEMEYWCMCTWYSADNKQVHKFHLPPGGTDEEIRKSIEAIAVNCGLEVFVQTTCTGGL